MKALIALWLGATVATAFAAPLPKAISPGERAYQKCYSCHSLEPGRNDLEGPTLHGVVGRRIAAEAGFAYSPAMRRFAERNPRWTPELLERLIADPEALVPGTSMNFHGMADAKERSDLVGYLRRANAAR